MSDASEPETRADIVLCPDGPMLVRGDVVIEDADGTRHRDHPPRQRRVPLRPDVDRAPWCDGTHKLLR